MTDHEVVAHLRGDGDAICGFYQLACCLKQSFVFTYRFLDMRSGLGGGDIIGIYEKNGGAIILVNVPFKSTVGQCGTG